MSTGERSLFFSNKQAIFGGDKRIGAKKGEDIKKTICKGAKKGERKGD